ncbi:MAG: histidinol-phosphatase [Ignavibacteriae bacterium HGW-Ignavibacteriae-3]|nr:MAG: histidinol-phosphatase [Ignavibacteriae bacterium HGW-Ignavibacteriae-3]
MFEYVGALHIHSVYSDGSGEVKQIAEYASETGLDFIILTDHNTLRALHEGFEGWYGNTLLLVGCEINDKENKNHYLAFGIDEAFSTRLPAKKYVKSVKDAGGIGFLAHPHEKRSSMKEHPAYPWTEWNTEDFTGIEIWNHMSEWMEGLTEQNKYNYFLHPLKSISAPNEDTLRVWDKLNLKRKVVGIGGIDAHAHKINVLGFVEMEVFPYKVLFKSIRTHILVESQFRVSAESHEIDSVKKQVNNALKEGKCFVSNSYHGDAKGFSFYADCGAQTYQMGDSVSLNGKVNLHVVVPAEGAQIKLLRNGELVSSVEGSFLNFTAEAKGAYRAEVYLNQNAWIFSNHIRIGL